MSGPYVETGPGDTGQQRRVEAGARRLRPVRLGMLAVILLASIGAGVADHLVHRAPPAPAPAVPFSSIAPAGVESTAWYCDGGMSAASASAATTISLVNTTSAEVSGTMTAVADTGRTKTMGIDIPARSQSVESPGLLVGGTFVATTVNLSGGGVLVSESVAGPLGWSETACSRSTSPEWYFASGSTIDGNTIALSLYNPTSTDAVVDLTFVTPSGITQPQPFEGIVVAPGALQVERIDAYVQDATSVSSVVQARTGAVVASELEIESDSGVRGVSVRLGVATLFSTWSLPNSRDLPSGATSITVFNPTDETDRVQVLVHPQASPSARFTNTIGPRSAWVFDTSAQTRIPLGLPFLATIRVVRGPGVVVDRTTHGPSSLGAPQFGAVSGLSVGPALPAASIALVPGPGNSAHPVVPGAQASVLNVVNPGKVTLHATVSALSGGGPVVLGRITVPPGGSLTGCITARTSCARFSALTLDALRALERAPLVVSSDGPVLVLEDLSPAADDGVVSLAGAGAPAP